METSDKPARTVYVIGGSSWAPLLATYLDPGKAKLSLTPKHADSLPQFERSDAWSRLVQALQPGDIILVQVDPVAPEENDDYLHRMIRACKAQGATLVVLSPTPNSSQKSSDVTLSQAKSRAQKVTADEGNSDFVDVMGMMMREYERAGAQKASAFWAGDQPTSAGAALIAERVISGMKSLLDAPFFQLLSAKGWQVTPADELAFHWPSKPSLTTLWLLGDSTVRNGDGTGVAGMWGWGDLLAKSIDPQKLNVANVAVSGRSSRTYYNFDWPYVRERLRSGDVVLLQFGLNDTGDPAEKTRSRASLPGIGDDKRAIANPITGRDEEVHTFGWYLLKMVKESEDAGATVVLCTPVPRGRWRADLIVRGDGADSVMQLAAREHLPVVDLNTLVSRQYEMLGKDQAKQLFADGMTHSTLQGAAMIAEIARQALIAVTPPPIASRLRYREGEPSAATATSRP